MSQTIPQIDSSGEIGPAASGKCARGLRLFTDLGGQRWIRTGGSAGHSAACSLVIHVSFCIRRSCGYFWKCEEQFARAGECSFAFPSRRVAEPLRGVCPKAQSGRCANRRDRRKRRSFGQQCLRPHELPSNRTGSTPGKSSRRDSPNAFLRARPRRTTAELKNESFASESPI